MNIKITIEKNYLMLRFVADEAMVWKRGRAGLMHLT